MHDSLTWRQGQESSDKFIVVPAVTAAGRLLQAESDLSIVRVLAGADDNLIVLVPARHSVDHNDSWGRAAT